MDFVDIAAVTTRFGEELKHEHDAFAKTAKAAMAAMANAPPGKSYAAYCAVAVPADESRYADFKQAYKVEFNTVEPLITEYYRRTNTVLGQFPNPDDVKALNLARQARTVGFERNLYGDAGAFMSVGGMKCYSPKSGQGKNDKNSMPDAKAGKCHVNLGFDIGVFKIAVDCQKLEISGGEGLRGTFDWNYHHDVGTVYLGAGVKGGFQVGAGPAKIGPGVDAEAGITFTFDSTGKMLDAGVYEKASASIYSSPITTGQGVLQNLEFKSGLTLTVANSLKFMP